MIETDAGLRTTREAAAHLEDALLDLRRNQARYHVKTYALLVAPILEELQLRRREIDEYLGVGSLSSLSMSDSPETLAVG